MKLRRRSFLFLLLLGTPITLGSVSEPENEQNRIARQQPSLKPIPTPSVDKSIKPSLAVLAKNKDAPIDGKDGKPHTGPFVETAAERDRKKAKESGDEEAKDLGKKPTPINLPKGASYADGWSKPLPESNDGVMDDPNRVGPEEGTRGTEGGISEKSRDRQAQGSQGGEAPGKQPDRPKEAPPLPQSEQAKAGSKAGKAADAKGKENKAQEGNIQKELGGLEKPSDLPDKPHDIPHPAPQTSKEKNPLEIAKPLLSTSSLLIPADPSALIQPLHSFILSLTMIIFSEIGDKTFLIAALMAMKHPRLLVFSAAFSALFAMTILSAILGHAVPTLLPKRFTNFLAAALFLVFGAKMLREGYGISPDEGVSEEMKEVEMELEEKEELARKLGRRRSSVTPYMLEAGRQQAITRNGRSKPRLPAPPESPPSPASRSPSPSGHSTLSNVLAGVHNLFSLLLSPAWVQTFVMTFLGEWGDRSQIATIAMAAGQDYWWVTGGAVLGHALCTAGAVIGGRAIAGRVSLRVVTLGGGFAFLVFGVIYLIEALFYA